MSPVSRPKTPPPAAPRRSPPAAAPRPAAAPAPSAAELRAELQAGASVVERRRAICEELAQRPRVRVEPLAQRFGVSVVTIRNDLNALAAEGRLVRTHGGALPPSEAQEQPLSVKKNLHHDEKVRIGAVAAAQIADGETVILDSGTTTAEIARQIRSLKLRSVNVITNALNIAGLLAQVPHVNLIMPGGVLRPQSYSLSGPQAVEALRNLHADRLFLGVDSLDPAIGLMTPHLLEAQLNSQMIRIARRVVAVADASKLMRRSLSVIAQVDQIHQLITDRGADAEVVADLRARGVEVLLA